MRVILSPLTGPHSHQHPVVIHCRDTLRTITSIDAAFLLWISTRDAPCVTLGFESLNYCVYKFDH